MAEVTLDEVPDIAPADLEELPPVVQRVAETILRGQRKFASAEAMAIVITCSGEVREGLIALPVLEQLRARHTKRVWGGAVTAASEPGYRRDERVTVCGACNVAWPCPDAAILGVA